MEWLRRMVTKFSIRWLRREGNREAEVSGGLEDHLMKILSFAQGDYERAGEGVPDISKQLGCLNDKASGIEKELKEGRATVAGLVNTVGHLRKRVGETNKAIKNAVDKGQDAECWTEDAEGLVEECKGAADSLKEAASAIKAAVKKAEAVMPDVGVTAAEAGEAVKKWHSAEQELTQMVERGRVLVSTTAINSVSERFMESARRQSRKILYLWVALVVVVSGAVYISIELWNSWKMDEVKEGLPLFLILRSATLSGLATLIVFLYRAMKPAEQERKNYEMKSNVLASSMAVHKESLSAPLQRVVAEELGWKATPSRLNMYLRHDNAVCLENLLNEDISVAGYGVICWDKDNRRIADYSYHITAQDILAGHESMPVLDRDISEVSRVEICDGERNVVARWTNKA